VVRLLRASSQADPLPSFALPSFSLSKTRVLAVGLNPTDWKHSVGGLWGPEGKQTVVGCDSVGEVVKVGSNVTHVKAGDRVFGFVFGTQDATNGSYAEYVRFNKGVVAKIPDSMSAVEAASFPVRILRSLPSSFQDLRKLTSCLVNS